ncbi:MAG: NAD(P)-dependent oxidoreductase [Pseudomonadota bacterium]
MRQPNIAVLGTGLMGRPMALNLLRAGFPVTVWNRSPEKARDLTHHGAIQAETPMRAVAQADFVITMLSDGTAVGGLLREQALQAALKPGAIWLDMSSIRPAEAREHSRILGKLGFGHLDAPVSGGTKGAAAAALAIMVGGEAGIFAKAKQVFESLGQPVHVGPSGTGQLSKLANQAIVAVTIGAVAEAMLLVERGGADPAAVRAALKGGFADSVILQQHGERMITGNFEPGGLTKFQIKDLDNLLTEARNLGLELPASQHVRDRFERFSAKLGGAEKDHSGLYLELKDRNGLE